MDWLIAFAGAWLMLGVLHFALCMKDWITSPDGRRPNWWLYAAAVFIPLVLFGPIGLYIRDWSHRTFPHWYTKRG